MEALTVVRPSPRDILSKPLGKDGQSPARFLHRVHHGESGGENAQDPCAQRVNGLESSSCALTHIISQPKIPAILEKSLELESTVFRSVCIAAPLMWLKNADKICYDA